MLDLSKQTGSTDDINKQIVDIMSIEKYDKAEFFNRVMDFYIRSKILLISEEEIAQRYKDMGEINLAISEAFQSAEKEAFDICSKYLSSLNSNIWKGADLSLAKRNRISKKHRHDKTR